MKYSMPHSDVAPDYIYTPQRRPWDKWLIASVCISLLFHTAFFYFSFSWKVADVADTERAVETLFKVQLTHLESRDYLSRPLNQQLVREREQILQQEIAELNNQTPRSLQSGIDALAPPEKEEQVPAWSEDDSERVFDDDQWARQLITSEISHRTVREFDEVAGQQAVLDDIQSDRIPLTGRGSGGQKRLLAGLPEPVLGSAPLIKRTLQSVLNQHVPPPTPDLDISEPPIELPPVTEFMPSPELLQPSPAKVDLKTVEEAKEDLKDKFINLDDLVQVDLQTYHHIGGDGYFMVRIRPIASDERLRVLPKDVIFVLDASSSMGKRRMAVIRDILQSLIDKLRPQDRFNIVGFKQRVRQLTDTLLPVSKENIRKAQQFTRSLEASGKTDIYTSLQPLVQLGKERARPLILFLISDGRPTVGVVNSRNIINSLTRFQGPSTSIFCVGTGDTINRYLLDMLAFRNRGLVSFEQSRSQLPPVVQSMYRFIEDPVLLQVSADFLGVDKTEIYPKTLPHLYLQGEIRIWGRLHNEKSFTLRLVGEAYDEQKEIVIELPVPERDNGTYEIARQWAFHKIYHIVGQMVDEGERPALIEQIRFLSRTYRIVTPYSEQFEPK